MDYAKYREIKITDHKMDFWLNRNMNVLLIGNHGVGKTSIIIEAFERNGLVLNKSYKTFSGGTLDPWTDFIGIPKRVTDENGEEYLEYIRPKHMDESLEAIFMDEYNRTNPKVRNALMELIQFKSINGRAFPNLKVVWAACNPQSDDDFTYNVDEVDEAQGDRFQIIVNIPYEVSEDYFIRKYGKAIGEQAVGWWNRQGDGRLDVSPRRLDYAIDYFQNGGDICEILPVTVGVSSLKECLSNDPVVSEFNAAVTHNNVTEIRRVLNNENNYDILKQHIIKKENYNTIITYLKEERVVDLLLNNDNFFEWAVQNSQINMRARTILKTIYDTSVSDSWRYHQLKPLFMATPASNRSFLVPNPTCLKLKDDKFCVDSKENLGKLLEKLDKHIKLDDKELNKLKNPQFLRRYWERLSLYLVRPSLLSPEAKYKMYSYVNFLAKENSKNSATSAAKSFFTTYTNLYEYVNSLIHSEILDKTFLEDTYYEVLSDYVKLLKYDQTLYKTFAVIEKDVPDVGDEPINSPSKHVPSNSWGPIEQLFSNTT